MKKFLLSVMCFISIISCNVFAGEQNFDQLKDNNKIYKNISLKIGSNILNIDGTENIMDSPAYISNSGYTMMPVRSIVDALTSKKAHVDWYPDKNKVIIIYEEKTIDLTIGSDIMYINGIEYNIGTPAEISKDRIFIPLRDLCHAFKIPDDNILWNEKDSTVQIYTNVKYGNEFVTDYKIIPTYSESIVPFVNSEGYIGYIDNKGNIISEPVWDKAYITSDTDKFNNNRAIVRKNNKYGIIDNKENIIVSPLYNYIKNVYDNYYIVNKNKKYGVINNNGDVIIPVEYDNILKSDKNNFIVQKDNKYNLINENGNLIGDNTWDFLSGYSEGVLGAVNSDKNIYGFIDINGKMVSKADIEFETEKGEKIEISYKKILEPSEGISIFEAYNGISGYINTDGKIIAVFKKDYKELNNFKNGVVVVNENGTNYLIDKYGKEIKNTNYKILNDFNCNRSFIEKDGLYAVIDNNGNLITDFLFSDCRSFSENMAAVKMNNKWGFVDINGNVIIEPKWDYVTDFAFGRASVSDYRSNIVKLIDKNSNFIGGDFWDYTGNIYFNNEVSEDLILVEKNKKFGIVRINGDVIIPPQYDNILSGSEYGEFLLKKDKEYFSINLKI